MKDQYIQYLTTRNVNDLARFLRSWISYKMPHKTEHEIIRFIQEYITHLVHVPQMFDDRYHRALQSLLDTARVELGVNTLSYTNNPEKIIKYC